MKKRKIIIVGATSTIAEHCARLWIKNSTEMILIGRDRERLNVIANDLTVRNPASQISAHTIDFINPTAIKTLIDKICADDTPDIALIAHGTLPEQTTCQTDLTAAKDAMEINGISPVLFAEAFATHFDKSNAGTLAIIGSVAGDRGRQSNYIYGAAKGLVARYSEGLQHRFSSRPVKIILIKPGPTQTKMTAHLTASTGFAPVTKVATEIVRDIDRSKPVIYTPKKWRLIMLVLRHLPKFIFNKLKI